MTNSAVLQLLITVSSSLRTEEIREYVTFPLLPSARVCRCVCVLSHPTYPHLNNLEILPTLNLIILPSFQACRCPTGRPSGYGNEEKKDISSECPPFGICLAPQSQRLLASLLVPQPLPQAEAMARESRLPARTELCCSVSTKEESVHHWAASAMSRAEEILGHSTLKHFLSIVVTVMSDHMASRRNYVYRLFAGHSIVQVFSQSL